MIVLGIAGTWLSLAAAGFAGLSVLEGAQEREGGRDRLARATQEPLHEHAGAEQALSLADMRSLIARALYR